MTEKPDDRSNGPHGVQLVARVARLLRSLEGEPQGLSVSQIALRTSLPRSSTHRLLRALETEGFVQAASPNGRVRLGPELVRLAANGRRDVETELRPLMRSLFDELGETVDLAVLERDHLRFVDQIPAPHRLRAVSAVGATFPLHCTANGKAMLALLDDQAVTELLPVRLPRFTDKTIVRRKDLLEELAQIREVGLAFDREEHTDGICAGGFAVRSATGLVAAISVPMPTHRFIASEAEVVRALKAAHAQALDSFDPAF